VSVPADTGRGPFSRGTLWLITGISAASLVAAAILSVFGDELAPPPSPGADGYSVSALGHRGLIELLGALDIPVVASRYDSTAKARDGLLVIAEPPVPEEDPAAAARLTTLISTADTVLLVLPKWYGVGDPTNPRWIGDASLLPVSEVEAVLKAIDVTGRAVGRDTLPPVWSVEDGDLPVPEIAAPQTVARDAAATAKVHSLYGDALLFETSYAGTAIWVLTDPDIINNHGLRHRANARFAATLIDRLRNGGPVVFDETVHGLGTDPSLVRTLFEFPLVLSTLQALICALLLVWAAATRFGPRRAAPPPLAPGKEFLIRNTAALLRYGGHDADALRRYLATAVAAVRHSLHAPADLAPAALTAWLERVRLVRKGSIALPELERDVSAVVADPRAHGHRIVELAEKICRWRTEMTHGSIDPS